MPIQTASFKNPPIPTIKEVEVIVSKMPILGRLALAALAVIIVAFAIYYFANRKEKKDLVSRNKALDESNEKRGERLKYFGEKEVIAPKKES